MLSESSVLLENVWMLFFMGFSYLWVMEVYSIFGDNINDMLCYLLEIEFYSFGVGENIRRKGKVVEWSLILYFYENVIMLLEVYL